MSFPHKGIPTIRNLFKIEKTSGAPNYFTGQDLDFISSRIPELLALDQVQALRDQWETLYSAPKDKTDIAQVKAILETGI